MQGNVLLGGIEEFRHFKLRQPNGLILGAELDLAPAVFRGVENEVGHGVGVGVGVAAGAGVLAETGALENSAGLNG